MQNLAVAAFLALRKAFFDEAGAPIPFQLRDKANTQDDPFDAHVAGVVLATLPGVECTRAPGPLVTPDLALMRLGECQSRSAHELLDAPGLIIGLEVKKLNWSADGAIRATGLDYNSTPPCGTIRVYDKANQALDIRGFYLFVTLQPVASGHQMVSSLILADGALLNDDFSLYLGAVGERQKSIGLGTYGDGANRIRPMFIFGNPMGSPDLVEAPTLVLRDADSMAPGDDLAHVHTIRRTGGDGKSFVFQAYRLADDVQPGWSRTTLTDPFPAPKNRSEKTSQRGRFTVPLRPGRK